MRAKMFHKRSPVIFFSVNGNQIVSVLEMFQDETLDKLIFLLQIMSDVD